MIELNTAWIMPSFCDFISPVLLSGFKMKYSINLEDDFIHFSDYLLVTQS